MIFSKIPQIYVICPIHINYSGSPHWCLDWISSSALAEDDFDLDDDSSQNTNGSDDEVGIGN